jgi:hypothetical protein
MMVVVVVVELVGLEELEEEVADEVAEEDCV